MRFGDLSYGRRQRGIRRALAQTATAGIITLVLLLASDTVITRGEDPPSKVDPYLKLLTRDDLPGQDMRVQRSDPVEVIIRARADVTQTVEALGGEVRTVLDEGEIITAAIPRGSIFILAADPDVIMVEASKPVYSTTERSPSPLAGGAQVPELSDSLADIRIPEVWALKDGRGLPLRGKDVIVAVVDSGIDWDHGDFKDSSGRSRLLFLWDQQSAGSGPSGTPYKYGIECTRSQMSARTCTEKDEVGHGTHVSSIAAGNGLSTNPQVYSGVAPESDLIVVKAGSGTARHIDAWKYVIDKATALQRPVVINNSWGTQLGAKDGSDPLEVALDALAGSGKLFVTAAGNAGDSAIHAQGTVKHRGTQALRVEFPIPSSLDKSATSIWYKGADSMAVSVTTPLGVSFGPVKKGTEATFLGSDGSIIVVDATVTSYAGNGDNAVLVGILSESVIGAGTWTFTLHGDSITAGGRFDAWLVTGNGSGAGGTELFMDLVSKDNTLGVPGTAKRTITVGNYVTKRCIRSITRGSICNSAYPTTGGIAPSSSRGPTRDGRQKPDIAAPGAVVTAALSKDSDKAKESSPLHFLVDPDGKHIAEEGTSMSAPHTVGVIALMLQKNAALGPEEVRDALSQTARSDKFTGTPWNSIWGHGKIDSLSAVKKIAPAPLTPTLLTPSKDSVLNGLGVSLTWQNPLGATQYHLQVTPVNDDGPGVDLHIGVPDKSFFVPAPPDWYGLLPDMTYTWRVRTSRATTFVGLQDSSWSGWAEGRFRTPAVTSATLAPVSPANGATAPTLTPNLQWSDSREDVFYYEFQLSKDPTFNTDPTSATAMVYGLILHGGMSTPANSYAVPGSFPLEANTAYHWRVRPRVQGDARPVAWPDAWSFRTGG